MGDLVRRHAVDRLGPVEGRRVWDLYAGMGETSELVADRGATVVESIEWDRGAVEEAERRQQRYGRRIERTAGSVEAVVASLGAPDLVITNPPRTGMDARVVEVIRARGPERVVYLSCDPATLARDVGRFAEPAGGTPYRVSAIQGFDLFPQTAHLETVAVLERG
jgi:23S rRNA (uracil1939-C5)-methyltransferase